jgi:signal transduction histidine kinase
MHEVNPGIDAEQMSFIGEEIPKAIDQSLEGVRRVASIVRAIRDCSLPGTSDRVPIDIHRAIEDTIVIAGSEWKEVAEVNTDFDPSVGLVPCIPDEFNQVILSLLVNASQAIRSAGNGAKGKGSITIQTLQKDTWVEIRISDTGPGIPKALQHRIFDPFFTTKEVGKGTGQGLYLAYLSVVKKHGGTLGFECPPGRGTSFMVRLPATTS